MPSITLTKENQSENAKAIPTKNLKEEEKPNTHVPPYPEGIFEWKEEEKNLRYTGSLEKVNSRVTHKLFNLWVLWAEVRNNEKLIGMLGEKEHTPEQAEYMKGLLVLMLDRYGKILSDTNITQELLVLEGRLTLEQTEKDMASGVEESKTKTS